MKYVPKTLCIIAFIYICTMYAIEAFGGILIGDSCGGKVGVNFNSNRLFYNSQQLKY